jgi:hypothetical protein
MIEIALAERLGRRRRNLASEPMLSLWNSAGSADPSSTRAGGPPHQRGISDGFFPVVAEEGTGSHTPRSPGP